MASAAAQFALLEALAETAPRTYLHRSPDGQSLLHSLYQQAAEAELVARSAPDDIARLHALFDVALDHGMGGLVHDYLAEVCSDRLLTSSDPTESFLLDAECVRRWLQKLLSVSRSRLTSWVRHGLTGAALGGGGGAGVVAKELGRLLMLQQVAQALAVQPGAQQAQQAAEPAELTDARRLVAAARVLAWLGRVGRGFDRPAGRFFSEQEWRSVVAKRREGAAAVGVGALFLADACAELAKQGVPEAALAYPPPTPDRLLTALFLAPPAAAPASTGGASGSSSAAAGPKAGGSKVAPGKAAPAAGEASAAGAMEARLALLAYYLADGGFVAPLDLVRGLESHFQVPATLASAWVMQGLLDDCHTGGAAGAQSLARAAQLVPAVDGARLPHKALQAFAAQGQLDAALCLLRQRPEFTVRLDEASVALSIRLQNGLLGEAFMGLKQHLAALEAAAPPAAAPELLRRPARLLAGQLLQFAASTQPAAVHAVVRLPFGGEEEQAVVEWLESRGAGSRDQGSLLLPIYYLLRGRTPEALQAYARLCPRVPASPEQQELAAILAEAARMLPAALTGDLPSAALGAGPASLAGSVPVLLAQQRQKAAAAGGTVAPAGSAAPGRGAAAAGSGAPKPMLFGEPGRGAASGAFGAAASGAGFRVAADEPMADGSVSAGQGGATPATAGAAPHEFDRVMGLAPASRAGGRSKRHR